MIKLSYPAKYIGIIIVSILCLFAYSASHADVSQHLIFRDIAPKGQYTYTMLPWTAKTKRIIIKEFKFINKHAPGLLKRATRYGPVIIYSAPNSADLRRPGRDPKKKALAWASKSRHSIVFPKRYFDVLSSGRNPIIVRWTTIHELTHIADSGGKVGRSKAWYALVDARSKAYNKMAKRITKKQRRNVLNKHGLVTSYAASSKHEALAEYTAATVISKVKKLKLHRGLPLSIKAFVQKKMLSLPPPSDASLSFLRQADEHRNRKQYQQAAAAYGKAIEADSSLMLAYYGRGMALYHLKQYQQSVADLKKAARLNPDDDFLKPSVYTSLARSEVRLKQYDAAIADLHKAIDLVPNHGIALYLIGNTYRLQKKYTQAIRYYNKAIKHLHKKSVSLKYAYYYKAIIAIANKNNALAMKTLNATIKKFPGFSAAHYRRALLYKNAGKTAQATRDFKKILTSSDKNTYYKARASFYLGNFSEKKRQYQKAINYFKASLATDKKLTTAYYNIAKIYQYRLRQYDKAIPYYEKALKHFKKSHRLYKFAMLYLGTLQGLTKQTDKSIATFNQLIKDYPNYGVTYYRRGLMEMNRKNPNAAESDFNKAISLSGKDKSTLSHSYYYLGKVLYTKKQYSDAVMNLEKSKALNPTSGPSYYLLAYIYQYKLKKYDRALDNYVLASQYLKKTNSQKKFAILNVAKMNIYLGKKNAALTAINKAIKLYPTLASAYSMRSYIYNKQRNFRNAAQDMRKAITLTTNPQQKLKYQNSLKKIKAAMH